MRAFLLVLALTFTACQDAPEPATVDTSSEAGTLAPEADPSASTAGDFVDPADRLNLNTATAEQFAAIPGVGDRMTHEFEEYRPWTSVGQFRREIGKYIDNDQTVLDGYLRHVFVPISPSTSDAETLMQLPGVSDAEAQQLVAGQPYASADAFLTAYESISGEPDAEVARMYLAP